MQGCAGIVVDLAGLRPETDAAHERVMRQDRLLDVHQVRAAGVVGALEAVGIVDLADPAPAAAVEGFHKERITDLLRDSG